MEVFQTFNNSERAKIKLPCDTLWLALHYFSYFYSSLYLYQLHLEQVYSNKIGAV